MNSMLNFTLQTIYYATTKDLVCQWINKKVDYPLFLKNGDVFNGRVVPPKILEHSSKELTLNKISVPCIQLNIHELEHFNKDPFLLSEYNEHFFSSEYAVILESEKRPVGWLNIRELMLYKVKQLESICMDLKADLKAIFESELGTIVFSDTKGKILRLSSSGENLWDLDTTKLHNKTIFDLEGEKIFEPSASRMALETGKKIQVIQKTHTGRRLSVIAYPIRDVDGKIIRVMSVSKDISRADDLEEELRSTYNQLTSYRNEIYKLQSKQSEELIYSSTAMEKLQDTLLRIAGVDSTVLVTGESGVGKELIVNKIHRLSSRSNRPIVAINCASIPESLLESELFGYESGAFTGASRTGKVGLFEQAHNSTLFLDEIGELPYALQSRLLRVLQERTIMRIGSTKPIKINVRIIAATNRDLKKEIQNGRFREDLYYRLNVIPIQIPPLRERIEDIPALIQFFTQKLYEKYSFNKRFSLSAIRVLESYNWPGNVRELRNLIEQLYVLVEKKVIDVEDLPNHIKMNKPKLISEESVQVTDLIPLKSAKSLVEKKLIQMAYERFKTTVDVAAFLDINQSSASRKINQYIKNKT